MMKMISVTLMIIKVKNLVNLIFLYNLINNNLINLNNIYLNLFNQIIYLTFNNLNKKILFNKVF